MIEWTRPSSNDGGIKKNSKEYFNNVVIIQCLIFNITSILVKLFRDIADATENFKMTSLSFIFCLFITMSKINWYIIF